MIILPAIDIKNGQCVRLFKGEFDTVHKVAESPVISAENFKNKGSEFYSSEPFYFALYKGTFYQH